MSERITHVRKPNRYSSYEAISHYGQKQSNGLIRVIERETFIADLKRRNERAYVNEDGKGAWCLVKNNGHVNYLQTEADATSVNNLLNLPSC